MRSFFYSCLPATIPGPPSLMLSRTPESTSSPDKLAHGAALLVSPRQELNLDLVLRRDSFYPVELRGDMIVWYHFFNECSKLLIY